MNHLKKYKTDKINLEMHFCLNGYYSIFQKKKNLLKNFFFK